MQVNFVPIKAQDDIDALNEKLSEWIHLIFRTSDSEVKIQSISPTSNGLFFMFPGINPAQLHGLLEFELMENKYQIEGDLTPADGGYYFKACGYFREQKRKLIRLEVPKGYPAHISLSKIAGVSTSIEATILDIHNDGLQILFKEPVNIQMGSHLEGIIRINKFPEVQVAGMVRYCGKRPTETVCGVELQHLDFGSEDKLREVLLFFRHDVFYFNKNKAGS